MSTEESKQTLYALDAKLAAATAQGVELQTERRRMAFDANTGDAKARKALDAANTASIASEMEIDNLKSSIEEAKRRLAEAQHVEGMVARRVNAQKALEIGERIAEQGKRIDEAFALARTDIEAMKQAFDEIHRLGLTSPHVHQLKVLGGIAIISAIIGLPIKPAERDHLAPSERKTFSEITGAWRDSISRWASAYLTEEAA